MLPCYARLTRYLVPDLAYPPLRCTVLTGPMVLRHPVLSSRRVLLPACDQGSVVESATRTVGRLAGGFQRLPAKMGKDLKGGGELGQRLLRCQTHLLLLRCGKVVAYGAMQLCGRRRVPSEAEYWVVLYGAARCP
eukprot:3941726-Rhodomonas_salina.2